MRSLNKGISMLVQKAESVKQTGNNGRHLPVDIGSQEYLSDTIECGTNVIQGWLKKHTDRSSKLKLEMYPIRYFHFNRTSGSLQIYSGWAADLKKTSEHSKILHCDFIDKPTSDIPSDFPFPFKLELEGKSLLLFAKTQKEQQLWVGEFKRHQCLLSERVVPMLQNKKEH